MATKNEGNKADDWMETCLAQVRLDPGSWRGHVSDIVGFWTKFIQSFKYPTGQASHGGNLWMKRMDAQFTMELADMNTYWVTMLRQLAEVDTRLANAEAFLIRIEARIKDGEHDTMAQKTDIMRARVQVGIALNIRTFGNIDGHVEEDH